MDKKRLLRNVELGGAKPTVFPLPNLPFSLLRRRIGGACPPNPPQTYSIALWRIISSAAQFRNCLITAALITLFLSASAGADDYTRALIDNETLTRLKVKVDNFEIDNKSKIRAQKIVDVYLGEEGMKAIKSRMSKISGRLNVYNIADNITTADNVEIISSVETIVFISSSIPLDTLRRYVEAADEKTVFVLRGTVGSPKTITPTIKFIKSILCDERFRCKDVSVLINPELYKRYNVERTPTVVVRINDNDYRFVGAMPLVYIMEKALLLQKEKGGND